MHLSSAIPWGGTPGKFNVEWGLIRGFERLTYPGGGGNEGGLFPKALHRGENGGLCKRNVFPFSSELSEEDADAMPEYYCDMCST